MNDAGAIAGFYRDANVAYHGFVRSPAGDYTTFDAPGAISGFLVGTHPQSISDTGAIAGYYDTASNGWQSFMRHPSGAITTFNAAGAGTGANRGTLAYAINAADAVTGYYSDTSGLLHGFLRDPAAPTRPWTPLARRKALPPMASMRRAPSPGTTWMRVMPVTLSCAGRPAPLQHSTLPTQEWRGRLQTASATQALSRVTTKTQVI
jgi:hypothetical protein